MGVASPSTTFDRFDNQEWKKRLKAELKDSGLPAAIQTLTREIVDRARTNALLSEADVIIRKLRSMANAQGCVQFLYGPCSFYLIPTDESSLKRGEPRTTTTPQKGATTMHVNNSRSCWVLGMERSICKSEKPHADRKGIRNNLTKGIYTR